MDQTIMMSEEKGSEDNEIIKDHEENKDGANMNLAFANHTHKTIVPHMKAIQSLKHLTMKSICQYTCQDYLPLHESNIQVIEPLYC